MLIRFITFDYTYFLILHRIDFDGKMKKLNTYCSLKIVLAVLLLICLFNQPYGYYEFVRVVAFVLGGYFAYIEYIHKKTIRMLIFIIAALLFNPIIKVSLGREIWQIVDVVYAGLLLTIVSIDFIESKRITKSSNNVMG